MKCRRSYAYVMINYDVRDKPTEYVPCGVVATAVLPDGSVDYDCEFIYAADGIDAAEKLLAITERAGGVTPLDTLEQYAESLGDYEGFLSEPVEVEAEYLSQVTKAGLIEVHKARMMRGLEL